MRSERRGPGTGQGADMRAVRRLPASARYGFGLAVLALATAVLSGWGHRLGGWGFTTGFAILAAASVVALAATALCLAGLVAARRGGRGLGIAALGLFAGIAVIAVTLYWLYLARTLPPIHDISTDTADPPRFVTRLRAGAPHPPEYGGPEVAAQQRQAYPDLASLVLPLAPAQALERALAAARSLGWEVLNADPAQGTIEATDTTFWYGFKDDVVVRVTPMAGGSRIDVRSVSRVGRSDLGANARRIRRFLRQLRVET